MHGCHTYRLSYLDPLQPAFYGRCAEKVTYFGIRSVETGTIHQTAGANKMG